MRDLGFEVFDDWVAAGHEADLKWQEYEIARGHTFEQALQGYAAKHVFEYDKFHLDRADIGVLLMPAGKSGHLELGYLRGREKPCFILFDEVPTRYDVMIQFAKACFSFDQLKEALSKFT